MAAALSSHCNIALLCLCCTRAAVHLRAQNVENDSGEHWEEAKKAVQSLHLFDLAGMCLSSSGMLTVCFEGFSPFPARLLPHKATWLSQHRLSRCNPQNIFNLLIKLQATPLRPSLPSLHPAHPLLPSELDWSLFNMNGGGLVFVTEDQKDQVTPIAF